MVWVKLRYDSLKDGIAGVGVEVEVVGALVTSVNQTTQQTQFI